MDGNCMPKTDFRTDPEGTLRAIVGGGNVGGDTVVSDFVTEDDEVRRKNGIDEGVRRLF